MKPWLPYGPAETYPVHYSVEEFERRLAGQLGRFRLKPVTLNGVSAYRVKGWRPGLWPAMTIGATPKAQYAEVTFALFIDGWRRGLDRSVAAGGALAFAAVVAMWGVTQVGPTKAQTDVARFVGFVIVSIPIVGSLAWLLWRKTSYEAQIWRTYLRILLWRHLDVQIPEAMIDVD